jgi:hypothetical protein
MDPVSKAQHESTKRVIGRPFVKGISGNPKGRPIKKPITEIYEEILASGETREAVKQQIISTMVSKGMAGVLERREMAERVEGKVTQVVDMEVSGKFELASVIEQRRKKRNEKEKS